MILDDICELIVDCEHKTAPKSATGYPSIRVMNVGRGRLILEGVNRVDQDTYERWTRRAVPKPGDLIVAREAPLGNVAQIQPGQRVCLGQRTVLVRPDQAKVVPSYLCYFLLGDYAQHRFQAMSTGATVPHLNMADIRGLPLPELPPLHTQQRIAAILSAYDDLIENNTRRIAILEEMARRLYEEWFVHFRFPGHETAEFDGDLPKGWRTVALTEIASVNPEAIKPKSAPERVRYIDIASVSPGRIDAIQEMSFAEAPGRARRIVRDGDIIWSCVRPNRRSFALILRPDDDTVASTGFAVLRAEVVPFSYLYCATTTDAFVDYLTNHATGAAYPAVKQSDFERAELVMPQQSALSAFDQAVQPMLRLSDALRRKNANLRAQRDLLLPKLVSGEIDVSNQREPAMEAAE